MRPRATPYLLLGMFVLASGLGVGLGLSEAPNGPSSARAVATGLQSTTARHSADVVVTGSFVALGHHVALSGTGQLDFARHTSSLDLGAGGGGSLRMVQIGSTLYLGISFLGADLGALAPGDRWISVTSPSLGGGGQPPSEIGALQFLADPANRVRPLGQRTIDGRTVSGYSVTVPASEFRQAIARSGSPAGVSRQELQRIEGSLAASTSTVDVWFDQQGLLRQLTQPVGGVLRGSLTMTFTRFGAHVDVSAPPPSETISFARFVRLLLDHESERTL